MDQQTLIAIEDKLNSARTQIDQIELLLRRGGMTKLDALDWVIPLLDAVDDFWEDLTNLDGD